MLFWQQTWLNNNSNSTLVLNNQKKNPQNGNEPKLIFSHDTAIFWVTQVSVCFQPNTYLINVPITLHNNHVNSSKQFLMKCENSLKKRVPIVVLIRFLFIQLMRKCRKEKSLEEICIIFITFKEPSKKSNFICFWEQNDEKLFNDTVIKNE